jgi:hypothetical protein
LTFPSIRLEGQIFSGELLQRLDQPDTPGQRPADFGLSPDSKVKDEIARAWAASQSYHRAFRARISAQQPSTINHQPSPLTPDTRNLLLLPLLSLLGYKPDFARKGEEINGKTYPISHRDDTRESLPVHLLGWNDSLDKRRDDGSGPRMSPHALVQEYLNLTEHLYGLVSNGRTLRLLRDSTRLVRQSFIEFDLERMFDEDLFADFAVLFRLLHASRLPTSQAAAPASLVEKYHQDALDQGARIRDGLRDAVEQALVLLGTSFLADDFIQKHLNGPQPLSPKEYYHQLLRLVYRLLFLLVAEERGLIFPPSASQRHRTIFARHYSLSRLRRLALQAHLIEKQHTDLWQGLLATFRLFEFDGPGDNLGVSPLGGHLFSPAALGPLTGARLSNAVLLQVFQRLCFFEGANGGKTAVNYGALATEEFGSVYESLLELHPVITGHTFSFRQAAGNERKTSGSYYTPDSLVQCLLDSALEPVVEEAIKGKSAEDAAAALLKLKVCDPAAGSGHFILGAAHRMARRLTLIRSGGDEASPDAYRAAMRDVISHCMYAVDINPMAVELCRINLWLESMVPGKPLSFLDHHIRVGNSLLGTTPELVAAGLPDATFDAIEGDDKKACTALRKRNKGEREGIGGLFVKEDQFNAAVLQQAASALDDLPDDRLEDVTRKEQAFRQSEQAFDLLARKRLFDAWCVAFFLRKAYRPNSTDPYGITQRHLTDLAQGRGLPSELDAEVSRLASSCHFFHWELAFADVFGRGGFDVLLGNPPWERVTFSDKEWAAQNYPLLLDASTASQRAQMLLDLNTSAPVLYQKYLTDRRVTDGEKAFLRHSGAYPLIAHGDINTYAAFAELMLRTVSAKGMTGCIVPSGVAIDQTNRFFFQHVTAGRLLMSLYSFENEDLIFPAVHHSTKFCLMTLCGAKSADAVECAYFLRGVEDLAQEGRRYTLSPADIERINPNTKTCATFKWAKDAELSKLLYKRVPVLIQTSPDSNPWGVSMSRMLHMGDDSHLFMDAGTLRERGLSLEGNTFKDGQCRFLPLYEAKMLHLYDHRFGTYEGQTEAQANQGKLPELSDQAHADPLLYVLPYFWVDESVVRDFFVAHKWNHEWVLGWRNITSSVVLRTMIPAVMPRTAAGDPFPLFFPADSEHRSVPLLQAMFSSFVYDYCVRQKIGGSHLTYTILEQIPALSPQTFDDRLPWTDEVARTWVSSRVLELDYTSWDLEAFAKDSGYAGPPFRWDEDRRFWLRAELDAAFFHLYLGTPEEWANAPAALRDSFPTPRDAVSYIMDTFPIVRRKDEEKYGTYRTKDAILEIFDAMSAAIRSGTPYQTPLAPPPAAPECRHPKLKLAILAYGSLIGKPGEELAKKITLRIRTTTPFRVEFGRYSKKRAGGPTLVPHEAGAPVAAELLILDDSVSLDDAQDMLWRREVGENDKTKRYPAGTGPNSVQVEKIENDPCVATVLYTDFPPEGKMTRLDPAELASHAVKSVKEAKDGNDGLAYLIGVMKSGIETPLTDAYCAAILSDTKSESLDEAREKARSS